MKELPDELKLKKTKKVREEEEEELTVPFLVYFKGLFLLLIILSGMVLFQRVSSEAGKDSKKQDTSSSISFTEGLKKRVSKEQLAATFENEVKTNVYYNQAVSKIEKEREYVLGEATKAATQVVKKGQKYFFDYVYDATLGKLMEQMIKQMPDDAQERLIKKVEKEQ
jgi:hypothetical protein